MDEIEKLKAQVAGLEAELGRVRTAKKDAESQVSDLQGKVSAAEGSSNKFEALAGKLQKQVDGVTAISEASAGKDTALKEMEAKLAKVTADKARQLAMADDGLPAKARDYFDFQYQQLLAADGDKALPFETFLSELKSDPVAQAFRGEAATTTAATTTAAATTEVAAAAPGAEAPAATQVATQGGSELPNVQTGIRPGSDPGAGSWAPGQSIRAAKENATAFAAQHGIKLINPERFGQSS